VTIKGLELQEIKSKGTVVQNSVGLGNLAANATVSANVTFQATSNQPGSNGDYHDSFWSNYLGSLLFEVIPGPGPVAQATISSTLGGTITVTGAGNPLNGTTVVIPAGALGDPTDTITIGYANVLPAALNLDALAAGIIPVSKVITLDRQGTTPLQQLITVTVPYSLNGLGIQDDPMVVYWEPTIQNYQPVQVVAINQAGTSVTFVTKHFSEYVPLVVPGLKPALAGLSPYPPGTTLVNATAPDGSLFNPQNDGFEIDNFSAALLGAGDGGVCYGLASYAGWYFSSLPAATHLYAEYATPSDPGLTQHTPEEDAKARELVAKTFADTVKLREIQSSLSALQTAEQFIGQMLATTKSPQLVYLRDGAANDASAHSVLIYGWNASSQSFAVYDPNAPYPTVSNPIQWSNSNLGNFLPWTEKFPGVAPSPGTHVWPFIYFDAYGTHYDTKDLYSLFSTLQAGGPPSDSQGGGWWFNTLGITSPLGVTPGAYPGGPNGPKLTVDPVNPTELNFYWNCSLCLPAPVLGSYYLYVFQDNHLESVAPIANGTSLKVAVPAPTRATSELLAFVSTSGSSDSQQDISSGYAGFMRADLVPPPTTNQVLIDVQFSGTFSYCTTCAQTNPPQSGAALVGKAGDKWNDFHTTSVNGAPLVDASGASTGVTLSFSSFGAYTADPSYDPFTGSLDANLIQGYLYSGGSINITLSGLTPNQSYTLYVYTQGDNNSPGRSIAISANGTTQSATQSNAHNFILNNNYVAETVTADGSGNIRIQGVTLAGEGDINGLQLVSGPQILPEQDFLVTATETCSGGLGNFCKLFPVSWQFTVQIIGPNSSGNYLVTDVSEDVSYNGPLPFTATSTPSGCCVTYTTGGVAGTFVTPITNGVVTETLVSTEEP